MVWCLGLGLLTTVLVAWVFAQGWLQGPDRRIRTEVRAMDAPVFAPDSTGLYEVDLVTARGFTMWRTWSGYRNVPVRDHLPTATRPNEIAPRWVLEQLCADVDWRGPKRGVEQWHMQVGWPWRAMQWHYHTEAATSDLVHRGAVVFRADAVGVPPKAIKRDHIVLPWMPVWAGLSADAIFFASLWWLAWFGTRSWKRWRRSHRGQCPQCGYARGGIASSAPCPECGYRETPINTSTA